MTRTIAERQAALDQLEEAKQLAAEARRLRLCRCLCATRPFDLLWHFSKPGRCEIAQGENQQHDYVLGARAPRINCVSESATDGSFFAAASIDVQRVRLFPKRFEGTACQTCEDKSCKGEGGQACDRQLLRSRLFERIGKVHTKRRKKVEHCLKPSPSPSRRLQNSKLTMTTCCRVRAKAMLEHVWNLQIDDFRSVFLNWARSKLTREHSTAMRFQLLPFTFLLRREYGGLNPAVDEGTLGQPEPLP